MLGGSYCGEHEPVVLLAHLICPRPEFRDRGKANLARHTPGFGAIHEAFEAVTKDWTKQRRVGDPRRSARARRMEKMRVVNPHPSCR